jgi:hypothetical protein
MEVNEPLNYRDELEDQYKYVSLIIAPSKEFDFIEKKLRQKGIECKINRYFL